MFQQAIQCGNRGGGDGLFNNLLWTNDDITKVRGQFTVNLDLSQFKAVLIEFYANNATNSPIITCITPVGYIGQALRTAYYNGLLVIGRNYTVNTDGITFQDCTQNNASTPGNNIPYKIYGIN